MEIIDTLRAIRPYQYYPIFSIIFKDEQIGIFISNMLRWEGKGEDPNGYIWKSYEELLEETGLNKKKIMRIAETMKKMGILSTIRKRPLHSVSEASVIHYRIEWKNLNEIIKTSEVVTSYQNNVKNFAIPKQSSKMESSLIISQSSKMELCHTQSSILELSTIYTCNTLKDRVSFFGKLQKDEIQMPYQSEEFLEAFQNYFYKISQDKKNKVDKKFILRRINILIKYKEKFAILLLSEASEKPWLRIEFDTTPERYKKWLSENQIGINKNEMLATRIDTYRQNFKNAISQDIVNLNILHTIKNDLAIEYHTAAGMHDQHGMEDIEKLGKSIAEYLEKGIIKN